MAANCAIHRDQAAALAAYAEPGVKVGVVMALTGVSNPARMIHNLRDQAAALAAYVGFEVVGMGGWEAQPRYTTEGHVSPPPPASFVPLPETARHTS
jgi:hypothetical protein